MFLVRSVKSYVVEALYTLFLDIFDKIFYGLISPSYKIFTAVAGIDIFGTAEGQHLYSGFANNLYSLLSVIMIFVFIYEFLMMLINPDGDSMKSGKNLVKDTLISVIVILIFPLIASYMSIFQRHVLQDNTIQNIVLNDGENSNIESPAFDAGDQMTVITFFSFAHPNLYGYSDFFDSVGKPYAGSDACEGADVCEDIGDVLYEWYNNGGGNIADILNLYKKYLGEGKVNAIDIESGEQEGNINDSDGYTYMIVISTLAACGVVWFLVSYAIDLGTRAIKLGVLEMIAPIPLILRIFPKTKKTFDAWFKMLYKTYLELFVRIAVVSIAIKIATMVPYLISATAKAVSGTDLGIMGKSVATICMILGIFKFAKDLPDLMKELGTGDLFAGMNFKPGIRGRIESNDYFMKSLGAAQGVVGGAIVGAAGIGRNAKQIWNTREKENGKPIKAGWRIAKIAASTPFVGLKGQVQTLTGLRSGWKNGPSKLSVDEFKNSMEQSMLDASTTKGILGAVRGFASNEADYFKSIVWNLQNQGLSNENVETITKIKNSFDLVNTQLKKSSEDIENARKEADKNINKGAYKDAYELALRNTNGYNYSFDEINKLLNGEEVYREVNGVSTRITPPDGLTKAKFVNDLQNAVKDHYDALSTSTAFKNISKSPLYKEQLQKGIEYAASQFSVDGKKLSNAQLREIAGSLGINQNEASVANIVTALNNIKDLRNEQDLAAVLKFTKSVGKVSDASEFAKRTEQQKKNDK